MAAFAPPPRGGVRPLLFAVDGERVEIESPDPSLSLSDYLRSAGHTAAKVGCGEGGCGACSVAVATWSTSEGKALYRTVNACLMPLCSVDGMAVTTTYGLGNSAKGYHPIQDRLASSNGSQCGFCSPGMVMSLFGMLSQHPGEVCPDEKEIESCVDGNLCRCTGYRAILSAFKSFAGTPKDSVVGEKWAPFPDFLKDREFSPTNVVKYAGSGKEWFTPGTLSDLFAILQQNGSRMGVKTSMIAGHTCRGIYKDDHEIDVLVDVSRVPELVAVKVAPDGIEFGGAVTWRRFIDTLEKVMQAGRPEHGALKVLVEHASKVAGRGLRNMGTLAGNLMMTKQRGFQSDLATVLAGVGASVTVMVNKVEETDVTLETFFSVPYIVPQGGVLKTVKVPFLAEGEIFRSYRTAVRPVNSHALTNAAFAVKVEAGRIESSRLVVGALGSREAAPGPSDPEKIGGGTPGGPLRASKTEEAIKGMLLGQAALEVALAALPTESWWPEDAFERHLSLGYMYKMFHTLVGTDNLAGPPQGVSQSSEREATSGTQVVTWHQPELRPIAEGKPKTSSWRQCAGEQTFTADLPEPQRTLYAAYVPMPRASAVFLGADLSIAGSMPGFVRAISSEDIPGANASEMTGSHTLLVPKGQASEYAGHPCMIILADTTKHAEACARAVKVQCEVREAACLTIESCVGRQADEAGEPPELKRVQRKASEAKRGDAGAALASAPRRLRGECSVGGQKAFAMEPASALVVPGEDDTLAVWGTYQVPAWIHPVLCKAVCLPQNKVVMNATHIGGGFGGKLTKSAHCVVASAVAAVVTKRPVRMTLNRNVDTVMGGGRFPWAVDYEVGFDEGGRLLAIKVRGDADAGRGDAAAFFNYMVFCMNMEQIYGIPNIDVEASACITDKPGNTAVRGPGEPEASFVIETILEHVAAELGKTTQEVREANIFTSPEDMAKVAADPTSPEADQYSAMMKIGEGKTCIGAPLKNFAGVGIWAMLKKKVDFDKMSADVERFNAQHRWRKRGLAMTPVKYGVQVRAQQALLCAYPDGTVLITCDATEIGQGLHTKVIQYASHFLSQMVPGCEVPMKDIRIGPAGTDKVAVGSLTGGSTTSEGVCAAVKVAIDRLSEDLKPVKEKLEADGKEVTFKSLIDAAKSGHELQVSGKCESSLTYHVFGAAVSEVEIDVLTGETCVLSTSMLYDCGKSLNPTIDLGQCEGAFVMGLGYFLRERVVQDDASGVMVTDGTWEYKIPCYQDVPVKFDVEFFPRTFDYPGAIQSSKASGEPPLVLASSVFFAVKQAVRAARIEFGQGGGHFRLDAPATPRDIALAIGITQDNMALAK